MTPARVASLLEARAWSQSELARRCGVTRQTAHEWLRGDARPGPAATALLRALERGRAVVAPAPATFDSSPEAIVALQAASGLSDAALARACHVSRPAVIAWRRGTSKPRGPSLIFLRALQARSPR
jgi:DNA-binding transcriptional regulator YiaG